MIHDDDDDDDDSGGVTIKTLITRLGFLGRGGTDKMSDDD